MCVEYTSLHVQHASGRVSGTPGVSQRTRAADETGLGQDDYAAIIQRTYRQGDAREGLVAEVLGREVHGICV